MMQVNPYLPEGYAPLDSAPLPLSAIQAMIASGEIAEGLAVRCDSHRNLHILLHGYEGVIPREEALHPDISGADKDIALLSRVGRSVRAVITDYNVDGGGKPLLLLSRRKAQERALSHLLSRCQPGTVVPGRVTHLADFGAFVDIGCGVIALLPLEYISMARIRRPAQRFSEGQRIRAVLRQVDRGKKRFTLSHRELLGTWLENAALFAPGETVAGVVRGIKDYGAFVELTPNLSGLADLRPGLQLDDPVTVYIRSIRPEQMKIKLQILQRSDDIRRPAPLTYFITDGILQQWRYAPPGCERDPGAVSFSP